MKRKFTLLIAALALLTMIVQPGRAWGQTTETEDVTLSSGTYSTDHIVWSFADGNITIQQLKGTSTTAVNSNYIAAPRVYKGHYLSFVCSENYAINSISIKCDGSYYGNSMTAGTVVSDNTVTNNTTDISATWTTTAGGSHVVSSVGDAGLPAIYIQNVASASNTQLRITKLTITYTHTSSSATATTVTIDATGITNTDVYISTEAGSLSASVTETESGDDVDGATVTWSSSNTDVATIDGNGVVTLVAAGNTTITASYAGNSDYSSSSATHDLTVTSSEPYVQPTTIEITPNYTFWGKTGQFSGNTYDELSGNKDNVSLYWTRGAGSTYANQSAMRFYKDNELTFSAPENYEIKSIVITFTTTQSDLIFSPEGYSLSGTTGTWTGSSETVTMSRPSNASSYAQITQFTITIGTPSSLPTPTVTIDATGITNTNVFTGTEAGSLSASVTYEETPVEGATVTWSGNDDDVATINETTGAVTLVAAGSVTFTATFAGNASYNGASKNYEMTVTNFDPDAPGTQNNPYTVAQAIENTPTSGTTGDVYIHGIVSAFYNNNTTILDDNSHRYYISDDGSTSSQLLVYNGKGLNNVAFSNVDDLLIGDEITLVGKLKTYSNAPEVDGGNYIVSLVRPAAPVATPTFNPEAGVYTEAQNVEISCETEGSTIYYTTDGTEPTNASTEYTGAISVTETTTIKAIAYVDEEYSSVATATYTIQAPLTTMDEIMAAANDAGSVATNVNITFGDWIVSGVGSNAKRAFVTDGTKGFIIYNNDGGLTFVRGDVLSGTKSCQVQLLNDAPCVKGLNASDFEITQTGQEPTVTTTTISALEAVNTGAVVDLGNLTWDGSKFVDNDNNSIYYYNTIYAGDVLTANTVYSVKGVYVQYSGNNPPKEIAPRDANDIMATPILATADVNIACDATVGAITYTLENPVSGGTLTAAVTAGNEDNWLTLDEEIGENVPFTCTANTATTARTATVTLTYTYYTTETVTATAVVTQAAVVPSITIATNTLEVTAESYTIVDDFLITYQNVIVENYESFDIQFYDANEEELQDEPDWLLIGVVGSNSEGYKVVGYIEANTGAARSAYFKVYAMDAETNLVYSNLVTINQEALVVDYATLPFEYEGGELSDFRELTGTSYVLTDQGSYATGNAPYRIKFTKTGDYLQVKTDSQPGIVTIGVKMIGGASTSYIYVQGSTDGATFDEGEALEISGKQNDILTLTSTRTFEENVRYVRLSFDKGSNVGVGPITIAKVDNTPSITINPGPYNLNSEGGNAELPVVYKNMPTDPQAVVIFYESDGETELTENPTWITATINANGNVDGHIDANDGDARSAYFKVKGIDANENPVYSALVTINQAAYTLSIEFETTEVDIEAGGEQDRIISFDYQGLGENPTFEVRTYDVTGETPTTYDWLTTSITQGHKVSINVAENTGDARSAYFKVYGENGTVNTESNLVTISQAAAGVTYTLVETDDDIEPGLHYIIVGIGTDNKYYAMAEQRTNNRGEVLVTATGNTIAEVSGIHEFVISGDETNLYTIYDESDIVSSNVSSNGYLYAAGANSNNYLKTYPSVDNRGQWTININETTHKASIVANMTGRNTLRYNYGSGVFSCYTGGQQDIYLYKKNNDNDPVYYSPTIVNKDVEATAASPYIVQPYEILTGNITNTSGSANALIVKDGGEIVTTNNVLATYEKNITEPTAWYPDAAADGWYTISSPVGTVAINSVEGLTADPVGNVPQYDLFSYNEPNMMWYNAQGTAHSFTQLKVGMGYLYAKASISDPIGFKGNTNVNDVPLILTHEASGDMAGFNLIGNPFGQSITMDNIDGAEFSGGYVLTNNGTWKTTVDAKIKPCQGFMVQVDEGISIIINRVPSSKSRANHDYLAFTVSNSEFEDVTYAMFSNGIGLNKISHRNSQIPMVYIPQNNKDYAIATMDDNTQAFNLNFKAMTTGQYTLSFDAKGKYNYLHVIDRLTGEDIDMLLDGEYTFIGSPRDNENRFIVKLDYNANIDELEVSDSFVYQYGSDIIVNGNGELQVFDALGRMVMSTKVNGIQTVNVPATGMYIFRMVGNEVKTQKIVVR